MLNGGLRNWELDGRPVNNQYVRPTATDFKASLNRSWTKSYEDILDNFETKRFQAVDARPEGRFRGLDPEPGDSEYNKGSGTVWYDKETPLAYGKLGTKGVKEIEYHENSIIKVCFKCYV